MRIENWGITKRGYGQSLVGNVYDDSRREDGKSIITSNIIAFDFDTNSVITETGSFYQLGKVAEDYEKEYPDAYNRFVNQFR